MESALVTATVGVLQLSVAWTKAVMLATVGGVAGLQPKAKPVVGTPVITGAVVSTVQVLVVYAVTTLPQRLLAVIV
jgi:hypothetical protein